MGKIKNDFQFWVGNNYRNVIRNGNVNVPVSELGRMVEEYIMATADRLNKYQDKTGVLPITSDGPSEITDEQTNEALEKLSVEEYEELKRLFR